MFIQNKIKKENVFFLLFFLIIFIVNYSYGIFKKNNSIYNFEENIYVKIISPNFSLEEYNANDEITQLKRLIKISNPEENKKTLFIWPEGIFYESYLQNLKLYKKLFQGKFSKNHLIFLGINNFVNSVNSVNKYNEFRIKPI